MQKSVSGILNDILDVAKPGLGDNAVTDDEIIALNQSTFGIVAMLPSAIRRTINDTAPHAVKLADIDDNIYHTGILLRENMGMLSSSEARAIPGANESVELTKGAVELLLDPIRSRLNT